MCGPFQACDSSGSTDFGFPILDLESARKHFSKPQTPSRPIHMTIKDCVKKWEPLAKLGGWIYVIAGALTAAVAWVTTVQLAVATNSSDIRDLQEKVKPIDVIRQDVRWIKKRLGGPDN